MGIEEAIKNKESIPYRQGVIGFILNKDNLVLVVQMNSYKSHEWRFPGGGIDEGETPEIALLRELKEELRSDKFNIVAKSKHVAKFNWSDESIKSRYDRKGEVYRGQEQIQILTRFTGEESDLNPDPNELKNIRWITLSELPEYFIFPGQMEITQKVMDEFDIK